MLNDNIFCRGEYRCVRVIVMSEKEKMNRDEEDSNSLLGLC